ncbi:MAG: hypothetical protein IPO27_07610 [Bacteroidetes bacterium]|nr:hypothetical protein [Bacteroidota bacterium]
MQKPIKFLIVILTCILLTVKVIGQTPVMDSLLTVVKTGSDVKSIIDAQSQYAYLFFLKTNNIDSARLIANQAYQKSLSIRYQKGIGNYYNNLGNFALKTNPDSSLIYFKKASQSFALADDKLMQSKAFFNLGRTYSNLTQFDSSLFYTRLSISVIENEKNIIEYEKLSRLMFNYSFLCQVFTNMALYDSSIVYGLKSIKIAEQIQRNDGLAEGTLRIAGIYNAQGNKSKAVEYYNKAYQLYKYIPIVDPPILCLTQLASIYKDFEQYEIAEAYLDTAFQLIKKNNLVSLYPPNYLTLGQIAIAQNKCDTAIAILKTGIKYAKATKIKYVENRLFFELGKAYNCINKDSIALTDYFIAKNMNPDDNEVSLSCLQAISALYKKTGNTPLAFQYLEQYYELKDSIFNIEKTKTIELLNVQYETNKNNHRIQILNKNNDIQLLKLREKKNQIERQNLISQKSIQDIELLEQTNELRKLEASKLSVEINSQKLSNEKITVQNNLLSKENELKSVQAKNENQKKNFAFFGIAILLVFGSYLLVLYSKRKKLSNQLSQSLTDLKSTQQQLIQTEREKEAENIRLRISRDIHDDIGHSLTKISLLSDMTASDKQINSPEAIETLGRISDYSRNVNSSLSEIVWAISPTHDSLDSLIVYMRNHIHKFFENTSIAYQINFPDAYENRSINPELKRNIFLVLKESLNNILKYAKAKNVSIDFKIDGDQFELKIKDDGVGFSPLSFGEGQRVRLGGNGLPNMKYRIEQTGGSFEINSSVGSGCEIFITGILF